MKKAFNFIESLKPSFYEVLGYPTVKVNSDITEVYFETSYVFRDLGIFELSGYDEFRFFAVNDSITFVFTFYNSEV